MENKITKSAGAISKKQKIVVISSALVVGVIFILFMMAGGKKKPDDLSKIITNSKNRISLEDSTKGVKAEDLWRYQSQDTIESMSQFMEDAQKNSTALDGRLSSIEKTNQEELENQKQTIESQASELEEIKSKLKELQSNKNLAFGTGQGGNGAGQGAMQGNLSGGQDLAPELPREIGSLNLNLDSSSKAHKKGIFNVSDYIPAGAYAKATIISGVDASVGISSQSDPRPVLLRVKGPAISSIYDGNVQKADLTGCIVQGGASGDLSSEKVYVKLITMTCGHDENSLSEIAVKGYVAGQGKSGIRGNVISREGDLLFKTFLAGIIGGFGQGLSDKVAPPLAFSNGLTTQQSMSTSDVVNKGLGRGISMSGDKAQDYLIEKAKQYQPVVSIPSGIDVEVVFVEGFYLNGKEEKAKK